LNRVDANAKELRYWEIPTKYTWDNKNTTWKKRLRGGEKVIGRMYTVSVKEQERYYLRQKSEIISLLLFYTYCVHSAYNFITTP